MMHHFSYQLLFLFLLLIVSCDRISFTEDDLPELLISEEIKPAVEKVRELSKEGSISDAFLFFTDPHLLMYFDVFEKKDKEYLVNSFSTAKESYDILSLDFCLCGGDWLNHGDTQIVAQEKLLFADSQMKAIFSNYHKMMGNHDTNYQGIVSSEDSSRGDLSQDFIDKVYFSETGSVYYSFMGAETRFYVFDSGSDWVTKMNDRRWEQILWLAQELQNNECEHQVLCIHMFRFLGQILPMSEIMIGLCDAYNTRGSIVLKGEEYNYSSAKGTIHAILSGHNHEDDLYYVGVGNNLPVIQTTKFINNKIPTFDICLLNYERSLLYLIRVGVGNNRQIILYHNI